MTKKDKTEAERNLLAMNHKRLNKAIDDLLKENRGMRKKVNESDRQINELLARLQDERAKEQIAVMHTVVHSLSGRLDLTSEQVADRAMLISRQIVKVMAANDL